MRQCAARAPPPCLRALARDAVLKLAAMSIENSELPPGRPSEKPTPTLAAIPANFLRQKPRKPRSFLGLAREWTAIPGVGYELVLPDLAVSFEARKMRLRFDETWGLLTVRAKIAGAKVIGDNILSCADFSFSSERARDQRAKNLEIRCGTAAQEIDWRGLVEEFCLKVLDHQERGEPAVFLADVPIKNENDDGEILAGDLPLLRQQPTIWFGDGGSAKSLFAMYAAINLIVNSGLRVLYCDWELGQDEQRLRLHQFMAKIVEAFRDRFLYRRCNRPLADDILAIREILSRYHIDFLICDSLSFGAKAPIESSESAMSYQQALRECGTIGSLHIAHMNRSDQGDQRPFGSTYWHNMARSTWFLKRAEQVAGSDEATVGFFHRKANLSGLRKSFAKKLVFVDDQIVVEPGDLTEDAAMIAQLHVPQRIELALQTGPLTFVELVEECGAKKATVQKALKRYDGTKFQSVDGADGIARFRLIKNA